MTKPIHIYADDVDAKTKEQFDSCCNQDYVVAGALMPDAHNGYVAPIGSVLVSKGKVVPAWVGYDIGCGVTAVKLIAQNTETNLLEKLKEKSKEVYEEVKKTVPMGLGKLNSTGNIHRESIEKFNELLKELESKPHDSDIFDWIKRKSPANIGTLGEGNHFIELEEDELGDAWIVIHSGSRNIGHKVAQKYMIKSSGKEKGFEETHPLDVTSELGQEYLAVLDFGLEFALLNRLEMAKTVVECIQNVINEPLNYEVWTNKNHNHAVLDTFQGEDVYIHRKGATPAKLGERGVIPGTMRDGCYLVEGLGNSEFIFSSSHGAGRKMSRKQAKDSISMEEFSDSMKGIVGTVQVGTLDEAPQAYKNISNVMHLQEESVKVVNRLKPFINWKGDAKPKKWK